MSYNLLKVKLDLKVSWKISRNDSTHKENFILNHRGCESEVAPNIRYGETPERIEKEFQELINNPKDFNPNWSNSFKNAVNNVRLKESCGGFLYDCLKLKKKNKVLTSFSIPIMELEEVQNYLKINNQFEIYKLKVCGPKGIDLLDEVCRYTNKKIRIDANEGFKSLEEYLQFEELIKEYNIEFIEQPFSASMTSEYIELKKISRFEIIADESVEEDFDGELFQQMFHGVNIKLMKAGGIEEGIKLLKKARKYNLKTMIGCMIETSLGISEAFLLASLCDYCDLDGALLIKNDPYAKLFTLKDGYLELNS